MFSQRLKKSFLLLSSLCLCLLVSCKGKEKIPSIDDGQISTLDGSEVQGIDTDASGIFDPGGSDTGSITGLVSINFGYDTSVLSDFNKSALQANAEWAIANPSVTLLIEGHCDQRGSTEYNLALGEKRAQSVKNYLISLGVDANRLTIISYGKEKLIDLGDSSASLEKNRRANFVPVR